MTHSLPLFIAMLVPGAIGIGLCNPSLVSLVSGAAGKHEQGRVQGAAGALESLGRTIGPVWGNGALQWFGEGVAYGSAALVLLGTAVLTTRYNVPSVLDVLSADSRRVAGRARRSLRFSPRASPRSYPRVPYSAAMNSAVICGYALRTMIRTLSLAVFLFAAAGAASAQTPAPNPEETAILAVIDRFMQAISTNDSALMAEIRIEGGSTIVSRRDPAGGEAPLVTRRVFTPSTSSRPSTGKERYWDPVVHVRGGIAVVWTPYRVLERRQELALRHRRVRHDEGQGRLEDRQRDVDGRARRVRGAPPQGSVEAAPRRLSHERYSR